VSLQAIKEKRAEEKKNKGSKVVASTKRVPERMSSKNTTERVQTPKSSTSAPQSGDQVLSFTTLDDFSDNTTLDDISEIEAGLFSEKRPASVLREKASFCTTNAARSHRLIVSDTEGMKTGGESGW